MAKQRKSESRASQSRRDQDAAWKDAIRLFFPQFLQMFHPELSQQLDPSRGVRYLEQELRRICRRARVGKRMVDLLAELPLQGGGETWLLVHIEIQSRKDPELPHRMWVYHYRTYDLYRRPVVSLAVLADSSSEWKPSRYESSYFGCELLLKFPAIKLLDLAPQIEQLETSENPFALVVASHLRAQQTAPGSELRLARKLALCRRLRRIGLSNDEIDGLFLVIDAILFLEPALEERFEQFAHNTEDTMELMTDNRFLRKGREEGKLEVAQAMMDLGLELTLIQKATGLALEVIEGLQTKEAHDSSE